MPGQTMQFAVQGVNDSLQGVLSDPIQFTMPPVAQPKVAVADLKASRVLEAAKSSVAETNGHANGHRSSRHS